MKLFMQHEIREATTYAIQGGDALHLHRMLVPGCPACFRKAVENGYPIAHLFSLDTGFLNVIARRHGIKRIKIDRAGTDRQHIDLCGRPLREVLAEMGEDLEDYRR